MAGESDGDIDAMYDSKNDTPSPPLPFQPSFRDDVALFGNWPADSGCARMYMTYTARWIEIVDRAAPRYQVPSPLRP